MTESTVTVLTIQRWLGRLPLTMLAVTLALLAASCSASHDAAPVLSTAALFEADSVEEAFRSPTAALVWPGASRSFEITPQGNLYNGAWTIRFTPSAEGGPAGPPRVIAYEKRWMPVAHWTRRSGTLRWDCEAVALASPVHGDSGLFVSCLIRASNLGPNPFNSPHCDHRHGMVHRGSDAARAAVV